MLKINSVAEAKMLLSAAEFFAENADEILKCERLFVVCVY